MQGLGRGAWGVGRGAWGVGISNFEFSTHPPDMRDACPTRDKRFWLVLGCGRPGRPCRRDACTTRTTGTLTGYRGGPRNGGPNRARHTNFFQHRRRTTISLECHLSLLPLGKSRWAKPNVAFRGRVGGGWGREKRSSRASARPNVARRRAKGAQRARSTAPTRACSRRSRWPRPRARGQRPRAAGGHGIGLPLTRS